MHSAHLGSIAQMSGLGKQMAVGATWMIALKMLERGIGFVSTLILARLLVPADFGLVAMAMTVIAFVEIGGQFGFDLALIRLRDASKADYDTAWSLQLLYAVGAALAIAALAVPTSLYFKEPRLVGVMGVLAVVMLVQGLESVGPFDFRKEFRYGKDFQLLLTKKLIAFCVTMAVAYGFRSYWALVAGMAASRVAGVVLSFAMHPYRPRFDLSRWRSLMGFSGWVVFTRVVEFFKSRGPDFLIGRMLGTSALGYFRVGQEVATLPTTELLYPIMRAVFPGYAAVANDRKALAQAFLSVQATIVTLTIPAAVAIVLMAELMVQTLLGTKWLEVIPLVRILGVFGALSMFQLTNVSIFQVLGVPKQAAWLKVGETLLLLTVVGVLFHRGHGLQSTAWAMVAVQALMVPVGMQLISRLLDLGWADRLRVAWRPLGAATVMALLVLLVRPWLAPAQGSLAAAWHLLLLLPLAAAAYLSSLYLMWRLSGSGPGPEQRLLQLIRDLRAS
jgi:lipopolysaccharide exporter